ncbi:MAG TPA: type II toxin-antitoxin system HicB family antitoxin [Spirochaetia bacterium]
MKYHFRVHDSGGLWAECIELEGCRTEGRTRVALYRNMKEALNLYLDEPESSTALLPPPRDEIAGRGIVAVEVDPSVAFSLQLRQARVRAGLTQKEAARRLGMPNLFSYQRLERKPNPSLSTIKKVKSLFPELSLDSVLGD